MPRINFRRPRNSETFHSWIESPQDSRLGTQTRLVPVESGGFDQVRFSESTVSDKLPVIDEQWNHGSEYNSPDNISESTASDTRPEQWSPDSEYNSTDHLFETSGYDTRPIMEEQSKPNTEYDSPDHLSDILVPNTPPVVDEQWNPDSEYTSPAHFSETLVSESPPIVDEQWNPDSEDTSPDYSNLPDPRPQRSSSHRYFLTVATMFKNERRWLREWLEFYLMMGVEHFLLYDHNSTDYPLEILRPYIDAGYVTYISWPPEKVPTWKVTTVQEKEQWEWFRDCLETCLANLWTVHTQGPCQMAAFSDAILRTKGGVSRWLGIWDVDEFIFPRVSTNYRSLADLLHDMYRDTDHIKIDGNNFGTSGHIEHAARRNPQSPLHALLTEEYIYRAAELKRKTLPTPRY